ncbi:DNA polymerase II large subunit [Candidatus Woesearchaeota archaeon]|nr:DNA polymerase II large subunit [Candidatus Woesearchaeota archaeon]
MSFIASPPMQAYFDSMEKEVHKAYALAGEAREKGLDAEETVSIPLAKNMAERVEGLVSVAAPQIKGCGLSKRIEELETQYGSQDWRVAFLISLEVAQSKLCTFKDQREALEVGLRVGLAYLTNGVVASPLEGLIRLELKKRNDSQGEFFSLYFGGPIRSAGTTATCIFVAVCDYVRLKMGYTVYDPTEDEIKRTFSELEYFHERITNLQYLPSEAEAEFMTKYLPVQIDGDPSEDIEVPNYKDLPRVTTNFLRNGFCLVIAEGLCQKMAKFWGKYSKWYKDLGMDHWTFAEDFVKMQKEIKAKGSAKKDPSMKILPDFTYIKDLVGGRPVIGHPLARGGFRLRYGRTRTSGFSSDAIHPATMYILDSYIAIGTQLKMERPKKSTVVSVCDSIEGPIVRLANGSVVFLETIEEAKQINKEVVEILYLGDLLVNFGDFLNRAHVLVPPGYCEEWWVLELEKAVPETEQVTISFLQDPFHIKPSCMEAYQLSLSYSICLHPRYTFHWMDLNSTQLQSLFSWIERSVFKDDRIIFPYPPEEVILKDAKRALELLGVPHKVVQQEYVVIEGEWATAFRIQLGTLEKPFNLTSCLQLLEQSPQANPLEIINKISLVPLRDKSGFFIGARMGRPEKAKMRKMTGDPHGLFPVGSEGGRLRSFQACLEAGKVAAQFPHYFCFSCQKNVVYPKCHICGNSAERRYTCETCGTITKPCEHKYKSYVHVDLPIQDYFSSAMHLLHLPQTPELIKGVRGVANKEHIPEHLAKGILRAHHKVCVNKDGTTRYDMTEMTITHFKPKEIGTSPERLRELGYVLDVHGKELLSDEQVLELKCQDLILPACPDSLEDCADEILFRVAQFLDDLLEKFYGLSRYYNLTTKKDLVGHLAIGLSPHTSAGIVVRIIGFSKTQGMFAHPYLHSIMRRDCDGDEAGVMLLLDALLNFSPKLLSQHRGATQDEPLVLTSLLVPKEIDDMTFDMDVVWKYPLEMYELALQYKSANEVKIETVRSRLNTPGQYEGFGFTHPTSDLNLGVQCSRYKLIPTMEEKVMGQMNLAEKLRSVHKADVARLIIERHFMRDIKGNLRKFSQQEFRCVECNEKFRRPPLKGSCTKCNGKLLFTISEGSIIKYLEPSLSLAEKYELPVYLRQTLELTKQRIELNFGKDKDRQEGLGKWFSEKEH